MGEKTEVKEIEEVNKMAVMFYDLVLGFDDDEKVVEEFSFVLFDENQKKLGEASLNFENKLIDPGFAMGLFATSIISNECGFVSTSKTGKEDMREYIESFFTEEMVKNWNEIKHSIYECDFVSNSKTAEMHTHAHKYFLNAEKQTNGENKNDTH